MKATIFSRTSNEQVKEEYGSVIDESMKMHVGTVNQLWRNSVPPICILNWIIDGNICFS